VGAGGSLEASVNLRGPIRAGNWHFVGDGIITEPVDVTFEVIWRTQGGVDTVLATFEHHFDPLPGDDFDAQAFEADMPGIAAAAGEGDELVLRMTGQSTTNEMAYVPNGDGRLTDGRIPNLTFPP
jgi:hypothetical protein